MSREKETGGDNEQMQPSAAVSSFISAELRTLSDEEDCPVISPDTPAEEIRRRAGEALGPLLRSMLGSSPLTPEKVCVRSDQVTFAQVDGEAVLLDLSSGHYYSLNGPGAAIWELLTGENDLGEVHRALCLRYRVDPEIAWQDLAALVHNLCCEKLAKVEEPSRAAL